MGWMSTVGALQHQMFLDELFASDVVLDHVVSEPSQEGDFAEGTLFVATLLIAFPDAQFGIGLQGGPDSLSVLGDYRSLGTGSLDLHYDSEDRTLVIRLFNFLRANSYYIDDDMLHMLALLTNLCQDRDRTTHNQVLSLSTSGNHLVDARVFHAYQLVEALLKIRYGEPLNNAVARWNATYALQLHPDEINFLRDTRDVSLHFKPEVALNRLKRTRAALGFDQDSHREHAFCTSGTQKLLRKAAQTYLLARA